MPGGTCSVWLELRRKEVGDGIRGTGLWVGDKWHRSLKAVCED